MKLNQLKNLKECLINQTNDISFDKDECLPY